MKRSVATLFNDVGVRKALSSFFSPLRRDGIESIAFKTGDGEIVETVLRGELAAYEPPLPSGPTRKVNSAGFEQAFTIVSVTFKDGNKWRMTDGQSTISATIEDADFLAKVNNHDISFTKDDVIHCTVRQEQSVGPDGLKADTFITKVHEHTRMFRQVVLPMPLDASSAPASRPPARKRSPEKVAMKHAKPSKKSMSNRKK